MSVGALVTAGMTTVLDLHVVGILCGDSWEKNLEQLRDHLTLTGSDLAVASQGCLASAAGAIALGLAPEEEARSLLSRLLGTVRNASVTRSYAARVRETYLDPFVAERALAGEALSGLTFDAIRACQTLSRDAPTLLPVSRFEELDVVQALQDGKGGDATAFLLALVEDGAALPPLVRDLLAARSLLGDAFLYFMREKLRKDPRVERTLAYFERQGAWADVRDVKEGQRKLEQALRLRLDALETRLAAAPDRDEAAAAAGELQLARSLLADLPRTLDGLRKTLATSDARLATVEEGIGTLAQLTRVGLREIADGLSTLEAEVREAREAARAAARHAEAAAGKVDRLSQDLGVLASILEKGQADVAAALAEVERRLPAPGSSPAPAAGPAEAIARFLARLEQEAPPFQIRVWTEKVAPAQGFTPRNLVSVPRRHEAAYRVGDSVRILFRADRPCHVHLVNVGPSGDLTLLFPNRWASDHRIEAERIYTFPRDEDGFDFQLQPPAGRETVKAVATVAPVHLFGIDPAKLPELFFTVPEERRLRNIAVLARAVAHLGPEGWSTATCVLDVAGEAV